MTSVLLMLFFGATLAQRGDDVNALASTSAALSREGHVCREQTSCGDCIVADPDCGWCEQDKYVSGPGVKRCDLLKNLVKNGCDIEYINPKQAESETENVKEKPLLSSKGSAKNTVQIYPQEVKVTLRPKNPAKFKIQFRQAEDYPVDLYYLMDLSNSMKDDKEKLADLGSVLSDKMKEITKDFRLGFGSFVDKTVMPYVSTMERKLRAPCDGCAPPYGFRNDLPLTKKVDEFKRRVKRALVSGNLDAPEGGFDAIMQSIVCPSDIKWRNRSRKLLLFSTDSEFHSAGDGKLGGIVEPNDGKCHLVDGEYAFSTIQDYPSISQINKVVSESSINLIFAVTADQFEIYDLLAKEIDGSRAGELARDSSNIVELVKDNYRKITSEVKMTASATDDVEVKFMSTCAGNHELRETSACDNIGINETVEFEVLVNAQNCPRKPTQTIEIKPVGLDETLTIKLETICECECESKEKEERNSPKCSGGNGTFECGQCTCNKGRYGKLCECSTTEADLKDYEASCRKDNETVVCSGKGKCVCGECQCFKRPNKNEVVSGPFCECENFSCDRYKGQLCGGPERGICECGQCRCKPGFTGNDCGCATSNDTCIASNGELCNNQGQCVCGTCRCNAASNYRGPTCEDCPTCKGTCEIYRDCVQCRVFGTGSLTEEECGASEQCKFHMEKIPDPEEVKEELGFRRCQFKDDADDCNFFFAYRYDEENNVYIRAQEKKVCPQDINIWFIIFGVILGIVAIGLALLLIWKLYTIITDRREFAKFENERMNAKWDTGLNPIYREATSTYTNPAYGGR